MIIYYKLHINLPPLPLPREVNALNQWCRMRTDCTILYFSCISSVKCNPKWSSYFHGNMTRHLGYTRSAAIIGSSLACKWLTCSLFRWAHRVIMYNTSYIRYDLPSHGPSALTVPLQRSHPCGQTPWPLLLLGLATAIGHPSCLLCDFSDPDPFCFPSHPHLCHSGCFILSGFFNFILWATHTTAKSKLLCILTLHVT